MGTGPIAQNLDIHNAGALGRVLGRAFAEDPLWCWVYPQPDRARRLEVMFTALVRSTLARGATVLADDAVRAGAIWQRSDARCLGAIGNLRMGTAMARGRARMRRAQTLYRTLEAHRPPAPHWYLAVVGTDPAHQGRGLGSALIRHVVDDPHHRGEPAYLETQVAANVPFYVRHGFEVIDELDVAGGGPHVWLMWRAAEPPASGGAL